MPKKIFSKGTALLLFSLLFAACGNEWDKISKKGNKWEYKASNGKTKVKIVSIVKENYKIGDKKYAEIVLDENTSKDTTVIYSWNDKKKALTFAGRSSQDKSSKAPRFFVTEKLLGQLEGKAGSTYKSEDGTTVKYIGKEKIKVPAGSFEALKFIHVKKNSSDYYWYVPSKGFAKIKSSKGTLELIKFKEGSGGDPKKPGSKAGFALIKQFYASAQKGDLNKIKAFFSKAGLTDLNSNLPAVKKLIDDIKTKSKASRTGIFVTKKMVYGLSFRYYVDSNLGNVFFSRSEITLEKEGGKLKIKKITTKLSKIL